MNRSYDMSLEDRIALTRAIIAILDSWGLSDSQQVQILGLPDGTPARAIRRFRQNTPFPDDVTVLERVEHVIGIADALRTTFPRNGQMGPIWMNQPNRRFGRRSPITVMIEDGLAGIASIRADLDCTYAWDESGSARG